MRLYGSASINMAYRNGLSDVALRELDRLRKLPSIEQQRDQLKEDLQSSAKKRFQMAMKATVSLKWCQESSSNRIVLTRMSVDLSTAKSKVPYGSDGEPVRELLESASDAGRQSSDRPDGSA